MKRRRNSAGVGGTSTTSSATQSGQGFRLATTQFFLTYPQCSIAPEEALSTLKAKVVSKERALVSYLIAREKHKDGNEHLHAYLKLDSALNLKDPLFWDLGNHHGNYQGCRSPAAVINYVSKENEWIASPDLEDRARKKKTSSATSWADARSAAKTGDLAAALQVLESGGTGVLRDLTLYGTTITRNLQELATPLDHPGARELSEYPDLFAWDRNRCLILFGATNTGKTTLAKSLLPRSIFTRHLDLLAGYQPSKHQGIILDDLSFLHLHDEAQIALTDIADPTQIHVRYRVAVVPAGTPRIVTTNKQPYEVLNLNNPAIARRVQAIEWFGWDETPQWRDY